MRIGFVGAGIMGHGMALNLLRAGHDVTVIAHENRVPIDDLVSHGAREAATIELLATGTDVVVLCLTGTQVARSVIRDLIPHLTPGVMVIDTTTNEPEGPEELAAGLKDVGCRYVEAPITGGVKQASDGVLGAIVGCDETDFVQAKEVLGGFCKGNCVAESARRFFNRPFYLTSNVPRIPLSWGCDSHLLAEGS